MGLLWMGLRDKEMKESQIYTTATDSTVTLYWRKPWNFGTQDYFQIFCETTKLLVETEKTHFTVLNLKPNTEYVFEVTWKTERKDVKTDIVSVKTHKIRKRIDISKAPYFACGDGKTDNTKVIQQAIYDCGFEQEIYIPAGKFLTGSLDLHSNMSLFLEEGAILQGSSLARDYLPKRKSRFEGIERECYGSLLNIGTMNHTKKETCENILIYGKGTIAGGGKVLAEDMIESERQRLEKNLESLGDKIQEYENENTIPGRVRGRLIQISNSKNIRISGLTLRDGPCWNIHMIYSSRIVTDHCRIFSRGIWNGDGWDPDSSEKCQIFACLFCTGDDAVAIKSGKNPEGNLIAIPCQDIAIFDCKIEQGHGVAVGSEISGGIQNVQIWDCDLASSRYGIEIKGTKKRGGYVRDIFVQDCITSGIHIHPVRYNDDGNPALKPPIYSDFFFKNIQIIENNE